MPWDGSLKASTALFVLILLVVGIGVPWFLLREAGDAVGIATWALPAVVTLVGLPLAWALAPAALTVGGGALRVVRPLRPVEIPLAEVRLVGRLPREALTGLVRTFGSGGAFGHYGRHWSRKLGAFRLYATRRDGHVLVDADGGRFVVTPGAPDAFVAALLQAAPRARPLGAADGAEAGLAPAPGGRGVLLLLAVTLGLVALVVGGILAVAWGAAPRSVRLEGSTVVVERNWLAPLALELSGGPESVRLLGPDDLRGFRRTAGTAFGAVRTGTFSTDTLGPFQLYAARRGPMWLLQTQHGKVAVVPDDPPAFDEALRTRQCPLPSR